MRFSLKSPGRRSPAYLALAAGLSAMTAPAMAQSHSGPPTAEVKTAMEALAWIEGTWTGEGWQVTREGREEFQAREVTGFKLGGMILVVEGRGWSFGEDGEEIEGHHAFGVLSYEPFSKEYRFNAFTKDGYQSSSKPDVSQASYIWTLPAGPGAVLKYHARLTEEGEWLETGERCMEEKCVQTFEMRLRKVEE